VKFNKYSKLAIFMAGLCSVPLTHAATTGQDISGAWNTFSNNVATTWTSSPNVDLYVPAITWHNRLFLKISGLLDPRRGRGMYCTFNARYPLLRWPLDHIFHSQEFILGSLRRLEDIGSDHYPFLAHLLYVPPQGQQQESLLKEAEDEQFAREILQKNASLTFPVHTPGENDNGFH